VNAAARLVGVSKTAVRRLMRVTGRVSHQLHEALVRQKHNIHQRLGQPVSALQRRRLLQELLLLQFASRNPGFGDHLLEALDALGGGRVRGEEALQVAGQLKEWLGEYWFEMRSE
jgi:hypothetical protein